MQDLFHGHYKPSQEKFSQLWKESLFAFDANIFLNLYRYSEITRNELFKVISSLSDKLWLPFQAAEEYFRNRISTTGGQAKEYEKVQNSIDELLNNLGNKKRHPFISDNLFKELQGIVLKVKVEFDANKEQLLQRIYHDEILERLSQLFNGKVGGRFSQEELDCIYKEGKLRYEAEIPPGFRDGIKDTSGNLYRKFGDLVIWKELIKRAKDVQSSMIFITDDKKDDWWLEYSGKTIGPLPILIQEFKEQSGQDFYMYTADRFMQAATEYSQEKVGQDVIVELKEFRQNEELLKDLIKRQFEESFKILNTSFKYSDSLYRIASEEEILSYLFDYSKIRADEQDSFMGLKHFVTSFLANKGIEINHAYATINDLKEKGLIDIYDKSIGNYLVKAIKIKGQA